MRKSLTKAVLKVEAFEAGLLAGPIAAGLVVDYHIQNLTAPLGEDASTALGLLSCVLMALAFYYLLHIAYAPKLAVLKAAVDRELTQK